MTNKKEIKVACAIIKKDGKILAVRRKKGEKMAGKWEFPGGKIKAGEKPDQTIVRELREELEIEISPVKLLTPVDYEYPGFLIRLYPFTCRWKNGTIRMHVHDESRWLKIADLNKLDWSMADRALIAINKDLI